VPEAAAGETPALPAGEHSLVGSAQPSEPFFDQKVCSIKRLAGSALDAAFWGQNIQYLPFSASLDAWAAETANAAFFLLPWHPGSASASLDAAYFLPWERRRLGGKDFCQTRM